MVVDQDLPYYQMTTHEYKIMAVRNLQTSNMSWWVIDNGDVKAELAATEMG
jgi:hypothetical protein